MLMVVIILMMLEGILIFTVNPGDYHDHYNCHGVADDIVLLIKDKNDDDDDVGSGLIFYPGNQKAPSRSCHDFCRLKFTL